MYVVTFFISPRKLNLWR